MKVCHVATIAGRLVADSFMPNAAVHPGSGGEDSGHGATSGCGKPTQRQRKGLRVAHALLHENSNRDGNGGYQVQTARV